MRTPPSSTLFPYTTLFRSRWESIDAWGTTPLYDATAQALDAIQIRSGRRALLLVSDGGDRDSHTRSEEHTSELQSHHDLVCRLLLEKKKNTDINKYKSEST